MSLSAQEIITQAPLGSIIRFSNGEQRPPVRFTRKLRAWENENSTGRLVEARPASDNRPGEFVLHLGNYGTGSTIVLVMRRVFTATSHLTFAIERTPQPGEALVFHAPLGRKELLHLAADEAAAHRWLEIHRYTGAYIEVVSSPDIRGEAA